MTSRYDNLTDQVQTFEVRFVFIIFAHEKFAGEKRNARVEIQHSFCKNTHLSQSCDQITFTAPCSIVSSKVKRPVNVVNQVIIFLVWDSDQRNRLWDLYITKSCVFIAETILAP